ncbi:unnamed protein product [Nyctereutes procyonoides]|uniref:(raccoon dog) hypothetical protein n=1 Tax=Nyctereutes procyonoides TaxID=34880 RepID=A0A811ZLC7_NYCPR|nr:unnamed protein product [Nyctereutes procyonoides]
MGTAGCPRVGSLGPVRPTCMPTPHSTPEGTHS